MCKVGGEVSNSIFAGHANKSHEGFVGDSSVGEWVNLGAGTTTSNLKNTYGEIGLPVRAGEEVRTGRRFLGAVIGDHAKTAVGTRLMTGSYVGAASMVATGGLPPRHVPSFTWLTDAGPQAYRMDKALEVMRAVYARRNRPWTDVDEQTAAYAASVAPRVEGATVTVA
jgi:bifunctional N-acetylglucosamine-1-phosphate-uridyltransferase/glucosamine-1-phosphate-acetyltransferase GlmU-like protein